MKDILMLVLTCFAFSTIAAALIGFVAFILDIIRYGLPKEKATIQKSVDKYEERLAQKEAELNEQTEAESALSKPRPLDL